MTNITIEKIKHLDNKPPKFKPISVPQPKLPHIQKLFYCAVSVGQRGSGKTWSIVKMLLNQEKSGFYNKETGGDCAIRHILFSPTISNNPVFNSLRFLDDDDKHNDYSEDKLADILEELRLEREHTKEFNNYCVAYKKYEKMSDKEFSRWKDRDSILLLNAYEFIHPKELEQPKYPHGCITNIILDDILANKDAFNSKKCNTLSKAVVNGRHHYINVFIAAQNLKSVTKMVRSNTEVWMLFPCKSLKIILDDIYPEISGVVTEQEFLDLYHTATNEKHNCLVIDQKDEDDVIFKRNFDEILRYGNN